MNKSLTVLAILATLVYIGTKIEKNAQAQIQEEQKKMQTQLQQVQ